VSCGEGRKLGAAAGYGGGGVDRRPAPIAFDWSSRGRKRELLLPKADRISCSSFRRDGRRHRSFSYRTPWCMILPPNFLNLETSKLANGKIFYSVCVRAKLVCAHIFVFFFEFFFSYLLRPTNRSLPSHRPPPPSPPAF
jgi:hypothetical protein